jgi:Leucine-rich repeat (LRR) protein
LGGIGVAIVFVVLEFGGSFEQSNPEPAPTQAPTSSGPVDTSVQGLENLILSVSPGTESAFSDPDSPQSSALNWLSDSRFLTTYSREQILQRFVMATLYYSTDGSAWLRDDVWLSDVSECDWYSSETKLAICNSEGLIDEIDLDSNNLSGELPWTELAILKPQLLVLDVFANQITGSIGTDIGQLTTLNALDLQQNSIFGTLPSEIEQLTSLKHLLLSGNELSGTFPAELTRMTNLETLRLSRNSFQGSIPPELASLTNLMTLYLVGTTFHRPDGSN